MDFEKDMPSAVAEAIDELNDAVFDPTAWERLVTVIGNWAPEVRPLLHVETSAPARMVLAKFVGWDPQVISLYASHYVDINVFRHVTLNMKINEVGLSRDYLSEEEVMRSAIYADILAKSGDIRTASGFVFARTPSRYAVLGFHYPHAREDELVPLGTRFQNMIAPTARNAFALAVRAASLRKIEGIAETINGLAIPAMVLDEKGRKIRANRLCCPLIRAGDVVRLTATGQLTAAAPQDDDRLGAAFARAMAERRMVICPYRSVTGRHVAAHFVPMRRTENSDPIIDGFVGGVDPAAIVYLQLEDDDA